MTTIAELVAVYGFSRSTVLRHVKKCFGSDESKQGKPLYLDEAEVQQFADYMVKLGKSPLRQTSLNDELVVKDELDYRDIEIAALKERCEGLERENDLLRDRLAVVDGALEREQQMARGFWSKLGQKLLGK